jgi:hypothetical protein
MPVMRQMSVFLENVPGRLATLCNTLESNGIDLRAMATSEGSDYGVVRILVDDVDGAEEVLRSASLPFSTIEVLALELSDEPGALGKVAVRLAEAGINVEYAYATAVSGMARALCVFKVADPSVAEASLGQS